MLAAEIAPFCSLIEVAVLNQSSSLFRSSRSKIEAHQRFGADSIAPGHEFIGAELIRVSCIPGFIQHARTAFLGADAVEPVVARNEIAAGISNDGNPHLAYLTDDIFAESVGVRELRAWIVNTLIDRTPQVLEEGAKKIAVERRYDATGVHMNTDWIGGVWRRGLSAQESAAP